jgi:hypothetical protein
MSLWETIFIELSVAEAILVERTDPSMIAILKRELSSKGMAAKAEIVWGATRVAIQPSGPFFLGTASKFVGSISLNDHGLLTLRGTFRLMNPARLFLQIVLSVGTVLCVLLFVASLWKILSGAMNNETIPSHFWTLLAGSVGMEMLFVGTVFLMSLINYLPTKIARERLLAAFRQLQST